MNYTLHQLRIFVSITETLSITKSAELLNLTQPAISIQLRNFQRQFDYPLIEIIQRKIHVTPLGKEIAIAAENIIQRGAKRVLGLFGDPGWIRTTNLPLRRTMVYLISI